MMKWRLENLFPPGYEYEAECKRLLAVWAAAVVYSFRFFFDYYEAYKALFSWIRPEGQTEAKYMLLPGAQIVPFEEILGFCFLFFVVLMLVLMTEAVMHYLYYIQGSRSILLVRRLPQRSFLWKTCLTGPMLGVIISAITVGVLYLLYYGVYILITPDVCLP